MRGRRVCHAGWGAVNVLCARIRILPFTEPMKACAIYPGTAVVLGQVEARLHWTEELAELVVEVGVDILLQMRHEVRGFVLLVQFL